jgi:HD-GYP domain-containing protein (c-di-GMP phosphodiesterase class II)
MQASIPKIAIDQLIDIVNGGGKVRTGIDVFNRQGHLLLEQDVLVSDAKLLLNVKRLGVEWIPIVSANKGGLWDKDGGEMRLQQSPSTNTASRPPAPKSAPVTEINHKIEEIQELKESATKKYEHAKDCVKNVLLSIQENGGKFDFEPISETVTGLVDFVVKNDNAFSYLTREIFSFDDYLYNHSINVCAIGTVIMKKFNENFSAAVNSFLNTAAPASLTDTNQEKNSFTYFLPEEQRDIAIGFFMHDLGKVLIDKEVLNKPGKLTEKEFEIIKSHSTEKGLELLEKNRLINPYLANISRYHHARLFHDEARCYPDDKSHTEIPPYVKVCKLADIYDAMTSKRCYKDAVNPVAVVTDIFHTYAEKDPLLQYILHSFVKSVGIYPPGSLVALTNGQLAYVLDSQGPMLLPVTDVHGEPLKTKPDVMVLEKGITPTGIKVDRRKPPVSPVEAYKILPDYLLKTIQPARQ